MLRQFFIAGILLCVNYFSHAQETGLSLTLANANDETTNEETEKKQPLLAITGNADVYYRFDALKQQANNRTSFTNTQNDFALGMASVKFSHTGATVSAVADLGFGPRASEFAYNDAGAMAAIKQLYISYSPMKDLKLTAGTWATHVGYELVDPQLNHNYSMSYMFTNGPFTHTGVKAEYTKSKSGFMLGISNATDYRILPKNKIDKKFIIAQYSYSPSDNIKLYANYVGGKTPDTSVVNQYDLTASFTLSSKFTLGVNGTVNHTHLWKELKFNGYGTWWGSAIYVNYDAKPWLGLAIRSEYFNDKDAVKGIGSNIFANTFSLNLKKDAFILIPEIRYELSEADIYINPAGTTKKYDLNFLIAAVYQF